jgi:hypothetical protein
MSIATRDWYSANRQDNEKEKREGKRGAESRFKISSRVACLLSHHYGWVSYRTDTYNKLTVYKQDAKVKLFKTYLRTKLSILYYIPN